MRTDEIVDKANALETLAVVQEKLDIDADQNVIKAINEASLKLLKEI